MVPGHFRSRPLLLGQDRHRNHQAHHTGCFGIWTLIDIIIYLVGAGKDKNGQALEGYEKHKKLAVILSIVFFIIGFGAGGCNASLISNNNSLGDTGPAVSSQF